MQAVPPATAATYLADAGALLEHFDGATTLQTIANLAVPGLADWCFIHLVTADGVITAAMAHADPAKLAIARPRTAGPIALSPRTALARVLAGAPAELVHVDDAAVEAAALDQDHLAELRALGFRSAVVAPLTGRGGVLGAVAFAMAESDRRYERADLAMLCELARRTGTALENARLFEAERAARRAAEEARDRTRRLQELTVALSPAVTKAEVITAFINAGAGALGAHASYAWLLREDGVLELADRNAASTLTLVTGFVEIRLEDGFPICDAIRTCQPLLFESYEALTAAYPRTAHPTPYKAWAVAPFVVGGRGVGATSFSFAEARTFSDDDRALLQAMCSQASLAFERCMLIEAHRRSEEQLRTALTAARAGTWSVDIRTNESRRDDSFRKLLGIDAERAAADFGSVHPDDQPIARAAFERSLREDVPYQPEVRMRRDDGSYVWIRAHGRVVRDAAGQPVMMTGVVVDIDDLKRASLRAEERRRLDELENARLYEEVRAQMERARIADRRKDEFLAMLGHELRNPLAPIVTALEIFDRKQPPGIQRETEVIRRQVKHLSRLVDDLLDVSRITRGKIQLAKQPLDVRAVIAQAIELASPLLEKQRQRLAHDIASGLWVEADPTRLAQVLQNVLINAAKYSDPETLIEVRARAVDGHAEITVCDQGIGMTPELLATVFEPFVQGERTFDRAAGGLGIGLAIARSLTELHGGRITASSPGPGRGSTLAITLPLTTRPATSAVAARTLAPAMTGSRVLVVDDNVDAAEMLRELLASVGHELAVAHDGPAALDLATTFKPDIAVLDIGLPVMNGYELASKLRERFAGTPLRLIAVTGYGQHADRARAREVGFDHHLVKPIELAALLDLLAR